MISCSVLNGIDNNSISHFDCLERDIPFLPKNKKGQTVKDIDVDYTQETNQIEVNMLDYINRVNFQNIDGDVYSTKIDSVTIFLKGEQKDINYSFSSISNINPAIISYLNGINPFISNRECNTLKDFLYVDIDISKINDKELKDSKKLSSTNGNMEFVNKILIIFEFFDNKNNSLKKIKCFLNITNEQKNTFIGCKNNGYPYVSPNDFSCFNSYVSNGSIAFVMDTKEVYKFNSEYDIWIKI